MPPRRRSTPGPESLTPESLTPESLTPDDLTKLATALADGRRATVYLREAVPSLGLDAGSSAKVVSIAGTTVTVRPRGVDDELPYEADELRITKTAPPRPEPAKKPVRRKASTTPASVSPAPVSPVPAAAEPAAKPRPRTPKKATQSLTVTIHGNADNEWSVALTRGAKKPQRSRPVTPESVDAAIRELGDATARDAVTSVLNAAREEAQRRVEELSRELAAAKEALAALENA
ncbi:DUF6319 family protein [Gordonia sp. HY285]|uniref:DUF6319 family protein n=1 Tax=Gordonia liuliyuniae TaxID=2911517 RepID=UPI001F32C2D9|nr:DUF6319 family protein [Gordonia liuliyuniae]MCF8611385.1 DUF6319 family protein [Gordonia liuliyuniae]